MGWRGDPRPSRAEVQIGVDDHVLEERMWTLLPQFVRGCGLKDVIHVEKLPFALWGQEIWRLQSGMGMGSFFFCPIRHARWHHPNARWRIPRRIPESKGRGELAPSEGSAVGHVSTKSCRIRVRGSAQGRLAAPRTFRGQAATWILASTAASPIGTYALVGIGTRGCLISEAIGSRARRDPAHGRMRSMSQ